MYKIKLPAFEGPFDLLLYLIKKHEIDIYDIPITKITSEYLEYIELMQMLDLELAGEFIEMVATLILIKTRMLLPRQDEESTEDLEDPRRQLTLQLLEYKRYKDVAEGLSVQQETWKSFHSRQTNADEAFNKKTEEEDNFVIDATLFDLLSAFKRALDNMPKVTVHRVKMIKVTLEDQVRLIATRFRGKSFLLFSEVVSGMKEKIELVVTFMALLDLMKMQMITIKQADIFDEIRMVPIGELTMSRYMMLREDLEVGPVSAEEDSA